MRIQHNIMAMNAYRNFGNNTSALSKNLEKLSSGYKINRAGDDAAGLAISEKMRAQITGLKAAQKNVKDGISLVKTAEGAMQEIHDMLNRMDYLATQSANGTYDNEVDRANLQKEVESLKSEIDRISKSANFNGQKLLDGSLDQPKLEITSSLGATTNVPATSAISTTGAVTAGTTDKATQTLTVEYLDANGKSHKVDVEYESSTTKATNATNMINALKGNSELSALFDIGGSDTGITFTNKQAGDIEMKVIGVTDTDGKVAAMANPTSGANAKSEVAVGNLNADPAQSNVLVANATFTINGTTYQLVADKNATVKEGTVAVQVGKTDKETLANLNKALESAGIEAKAETGKLVFSGTKDGTPMKLQIGDTSADYEQLEVRIGNMSSASLGIGDLNIGTPEGAHAAIDKIKAA
ncbi:flagellin, partial [uncultured Intestinimonas sp.]